MPNRGLLTVIAPLLLVACASDPPAQTGAQRVNAIADAYRAGLLEQQPELAYFAGIELESHDGLSDNSPAALARWEKREDGWLKAVHAIDANALVGTTEWITLGAMREQLEASVQLRVCHSESWQTVNHMESWHTTFATLAELQPVDTEAHRNQALARWRKIAPYIRQEIPNLRGGLEHKYSAARAVAERMLKQLDGMIAAPLDENHPYASPAKRSTDAEFKKQFLALLGDEVLPAMREYRAFLADEYLPHARTALAVTTLPDGMACYQAMLRSYTTLSRTPAEVKALGEKVVDANRQEVQALGKKLFGIDDLPTILAQAKTAPDNQFANPADTLAGSREMVLRAEAAMPRYFGQVPTQHVSVEPIPAYEDGAGASSHYEPPQADGTPGIYRISLLRPGGTTRSEAEVTAFHETWPGHHLQIAYAQRIRDAHPLMQLIFNSGYVEGWARYAENLSEEAGLYHTDYAKLQRRAWPARGMVVDPGIHAFGWTREQAIAFIMEAGRDNEQSAGNLVDRIAAIPGQLTAYDSGAQEFFALRRQAEATLGNKFDIRAFHDAVLGKGTIPLPMLREVTNRWLATQQAAP
jgi:uncharacterized protein (DUF885 family)